MVLTKDLMKFSCLVGFISNAKVKVKCVFHKLVSKIEANSRIVLEKRYLGIYAAEHSKCPVDDQHETQCK